MRGKGSRVGVDGEDVRLFCFNDTATTEIYTLSLHDALPIWGRCRNKKWSVKKEGAASTRNGQYKMQGRCRNEKWAV